MECFYSYFVLLYTDADEIYTSIFICYIFMYTFIAILLVYVNYLTSCSSNAFEINPRKIRNNQTNLFSWLMIVSCRWRDLLITHLTSILLSHIVKGKRDTNFIASFIFRCGFVGQTYRILGIFRILLLVICVV